MEFEEAMMVRAAAQGDQKAQRWLDGLDERAQFQEAVRRADWFRQAWANSQGCTVEEAERAYEVLVLKRQTEPA